MKVLVLLFLASCSFFRAKLYQDVPLGHQPLVGQRLVARDGYNGKLTNRVCLSFDSNKCVETSLIEYDLNVPDVRKTLVELGFACNVGGKRFRVCADSAGLCRVEAHEICIEYRKTFFFRREVCAKEKIEITNHFLSINDDYSFLLDSATECRAGY